MENKFLRVLLIITLINMTILSGCKANTVTTPTPTKVAAILAEATGVDLKGRVIKMLSYAPAGKVVDAFGDTTDVLPSLRLKQIKEIQTKYNCTFEYVHLDGESTYQSIMAGQTPADYFTTDEYLFYLDEDGNTIFQPLDQYADILDMDNPNIWDVTKQKQLSLGKCTQVVCTAGDVYDALQFYQSVFFNISMLKKAGLWERYNIYDLQQRKTWNWDTFSKLSTQIKADTNKDGKTDRYGVYFDSFTLDALAVSNGDGISSSTIITFDKGKAQVSLSKPTQRTALDFLLSLNNKGAVLTSTLEDREASPYPESVENFVNRKVLFFIGRMDETYYLQKDIKDEWGMAAVPMGPNNATHEYRTAKVGGLGTGILRGAKDSKMLCRILKDLSMPVLPPKELSNALLTDLKQSGYNSSVCDTIAMITDPDAAQYCESLIAVAGSRYFASVTYLLKGQMTEKELFEKHLPVVQKNLDEQWGKVAANLDALKKEYQS